MIISFTNTMILSLSRNICPDRLFSFKFVRLLEKVFLSTGYSIMHQFSLGISVISRIDSQRTSYNHKVIYT